MFTSPVRGIKKLALQTEISTTTSKSHILWLCQHMGGSEVYKNKCSTAETFCLLQMFGCPLIKYITGSQWMIETLPTIAPAISFSPRCGRAFSSQALINKGIAGWLKAAICTPRTSITPVTAHLTVLISGDI